MPQQQNLIWDGRRGFAVCRHLADMRVQRVRELVPLRELLFGLSVKRFRRYPVIEPRHLIGSLQQRIWGARIAPPVDVISDDAQQYGQKQTGSDGNGGGNGDSHSAPFTLSSIL